MQRYDTYKPSGVKWLGEIPSHWEVIKTSHLFTHIGSGTTPKSGSEEYYTEDGIPFLQTGDLNDGFIVDTSKKITEKAFRDTNLTIYLQGSLVIAMYGATIGKLGILGIDTTVNQACCVLPKSPKVETRYAFYAYLAAKNDLIFQSKGGGQPNISQDTIKNERIPVPSRAEQTAIANYLDTATAKIDAAIAQQQKMIDLLNERKQIIINRAVTRGLNPNARMKDSGVEWIGEVPEHWEVRKVKSITSKVGSGVTPRGGGETYVDKGVMFLRSQNIYFEGFKLDDVAFITDDVDASMSNTRVKEGDVLFNITGGSIGRCCYVPKGFPKANVNQHVSIVRPHNFSTEYLYYLLRSPMSQMQVDLQQTGGNREGLSAFALKNFVFPIPPKTEQEKIIVYLNDVDLKLEQTIQNCQQNQISLLQERKQIIINEVVTGKVKVM